MLLEDRLVLEYLYVLQSTSLLCGIYDVEVPYLRISNTLGIYNVHALAIHRTYLSLNLSNCLNSCFPSRLIAPNIQKFLCEPVIVTTGLESL